MLDLPNLIVVSSSMIQQLPLQFLTGASESRTKFLNSIELIFLKHIVVGIESISLYSFHPFMFYHEDSELNTLNVDVLVEQSNKIKKYREAFEKVKMIPSMLYIFPN